jgi:tetratricopeptide (TPR) repeat protein
MIDVPFDVSFHFDENLRDVPNCPAEMRLAVTALQAQLTDPSLDPQRRIQLLGSIGTYARMLEDLALAHQALSWAVELADRAGNRRLKTANLGRLAHVYQWQHNYRVSEDLFEAMILSCQQEPDLFLYLDFAYQHAGKCQFDQQQYPAALGYFEQALALRLIKTDRALIDSTQLAIEVTRRRLA